MADRAGQFRTTKQSSILVRLGDKHWSVQTESAAAPAIEEPIEQPSVRIQQTTQKVITAKSISSYRAPKRRYKRRRHRQNPFIRIIVTIVSHVLQTLFEKRPKMWVAGLQGGLIVGMLFGCLAMFLFHQMAPLPAMTAQAPVDPSSATEPVALTAPHKLVNVPGFQFYTVSCGTFSNQSSADAKVSSLSKQGIQAVVVQWKGYSVFAGSAMTKEDASKLRDSIAKKDKNASVQMVRETAHALPVLGTISQDGLKSTESWLADSCSALRALTAWSSDGGRSSDAATALKAALAAYPSDTIISQTGVSDEMAHFYTVMQQAEKDFQNKDQARVMNDVEQAFVELATFHGITASA